jgi:hypothetical protein
MGTRKQRHFLSAGYSAGAERGGHHWWGPGSFLGLIGKQLGSNPDGIGAGVSPMLQ